jgi:hypothetical protein
MALSSWLGLSAAVICATASATGCTMGNWNSIHREFKTTQMKSQLVDVKQRSILVQNGVPSIEQVQVTRDGETTMQERVVPGRPFVCAEPSPDALSVYSSAMMAAAEHPSGASGSLQFTSSEAGIAFGLRTQSIQLLRDAYYRACEARLSGSIDEETYDVLVRRLNSQAVAYLAIEQITSGASSAVKSSVQAPNLDPLVKAVEAAAKTVTDLEQKKSDLAALLAAEPDAEKKKPIQASIDDTTKKIESAKGEKKKADDALLAGGKAIVTAASEEKKSVAVSDAAVNAAKEIALSIVDGDNSPQMCFAYRRRHRDRTVSNDPVSAYCFAVLKNHQEAQAAAVARARAFAAAIDRHCGRELGTDAARALCASLITAAGSPSPGQTPGQSSGPPMRMHGI